MFNCRWFLDLKDMVNEKKHMHLIAIASQANQEILINGDHLSIILPKKKQVGWDTLLTDATLTVKEAPEYKFSYNDVEVGEFCLFAVKATELVMNKFYLKYFS